MRWKFWEKKPLTEEEFLRLYKKHLYEYTVYHLEYFETFESLMSKIKDRLKFGKCPFKGGGWRLFFSSKEKKDFKRASGYYVVSRLSNVRLRAKMFTIAEDFLQNRTRTVRR